ncbi:MAG: hypothetical protein ABI779_18440 [Acidobacteriota bacterium]
MKILLAAGATLAMTACMTVRTQTPTMAVSAPQAMATTQEVVDTDVIVDEAPPVSRAIAEAQEARLQALLQPLRARAMEGANLPTEAVIIGSLPFPTRTVTGVRYDTAQDWVRRTEADVRQRIESPEFRETELHDVAAFVHSQVDARIHESDMRLMEGGLVSRDVVQRYVRDFLSIFDQATTASQFRVTFTVLTEPRGATFELCHEYPPSDCTAVGTNVKIPDVFRGRYIYRIRLGGYHLVEAPLNLVNFGQTLLRCPLRALTNPAGAVPCTPE